MSLAERIANYSRNAHLWLPGLVGTQWRRRGNIAPKRVWLLIADHYEPLWRGATPQVARERVELWRREWPRVADRHRDTAGRKPQYTFFYPEEQYAPEYLDPLAEMKALGIGDVEIHLHHDCDTEPAFLDRMGQFLEILSNRHGLLRQDQGRIRFGFIHGNWALDNSRPDGRYCGLNNEIGLLSKLGCYADFTLPAAPTAAQTRTINTIYWATDDPEKPRSHEYGVPVLPGGQVAGDLMIVPGPLGLLWRGSGRPWPRLETGELAEYCAPTAERVGIWLKYAPRIGEDVFLKLFAHGAQEAHARMLLGGGLDRCFDLLRRTCEEQGLELRYATAWEMWRAIEAVRRGSN